MPRHFPVERSTSPGRISHSSADPPWSWIAPVGRSSRVCGGVACAQVRPMWRATRRIGVVFMRFRGWGSFILGEFESVRKLHSKTRDWNSANTALCSGDVKTFQRSQGVCGDRVKFVAAGLADHFGFSHRIRVSRQPSAVSSLGSGQAFQLLHISAGEGICAMGLLTFILGLVCQRLHPRKHTETSRREVDHLLEILCVD